MLIAYLCFIGYLGILFNFAAMSDDKIYVAFHNKGKVVSNDQIYCALQVGKDTSKNNLDILHDASGDNISQKNEIYSELTGWYWIWKNVKHDIVGTAHYRRYFTLETMSWIRGIGKSILQIAGLKKKRHGLWYVKSPEKWKDKILAHNEIEVLMQHYDIILPQKKRFKYSVEEQYIRRHNRIDIKTTRDIISEFHSDYLNSFDTVFKSSEMYSFNMFIMPWNLFDNYMKWLFGILFELEKRSDIDMDDKYQKRLCAFMAERLQTVWIAHHKLKIKELPVLYFKRSKTAHF